MVYLPSSTDLPEILNAAVERCTDSDSTRRPTASELLDTLSGDLLGNQA